MVPVTTKPFMNRGVLPKMQRESLHFFLLITKKISQFITSCESRVAGITTSALRDIPIRQGKGTIQLAPQSSLHSILASFIGFQFRYRNWIVRLTNFIALCLQNLRLRLTLPTVSESH